MWTRSKTHLLLLHKVNEGGSLYLHGLTLSVVQSQHEVEEVGLAEVGGRLLLEVCPGETHAAADTSTDPAPPSTEAITTTFTVKQTQK